MERSYSYILTKNKQTKNPVFIGEVVLLSEHTTFGKDILGTVRKEAISA